MAEADPAMEEEVEQEEALGAAAWQALQSLPLPGRVFLVLSMCLCMTTVYFAGIASFRSWSIDRTEKLIEKCNVDMLELEKQLTNEEATKTSDSQIWELQKELEEKHATIASMSVELENSIAALTQQCLSRAQELEGEIESAAETKACQQAQESESMQAGAPVDPKISELHRQLTDKDAHLARLSSEIEDATTALEQRGLKIEELEKQLQDSSATPARESQQPDSASPELGRAESKISDLQKQLEEKDVRLAQLSSEVGDADDTLAQRDLQILEKEKQLLDANASCLDAPQQLKNVTSAFGEANFNSSELQRQLTAKDAQIAQQEEEAQRQTFITRVLFIIALIVYLGRAQIFPGA